MVAPYTPPLLVAPIVNPAVGGFIKPVPYLSVSQYNYAPTAMDTESLEPFGTAADQTQVLADTIFRASAWADRIIFGTAPAAKGASLCASQSTGTARVKCLQGEYRLLCDYKPILELDALAFGPNPADLNPIDQATAAQIWFDGRVIIVPSLGTFAQVNGPGVFIGRPGGRTYAVWTYVAGYPHLRLAAEADAGAESITVLPNGPGDTLLGIYPGTPLSIDDVGQTEDITVASIEGTTINLTSPLVNDHSIPNGPDFTPVTALPGDVSQAVVFLTTALIKTRGDNSIVLDEIDEPEKIQSTADAVQSDLKTAFDMLAPFRITSKARS